MKRMPLHEQILFSTQERRLCICNRCDLCELGDLSMLAMTEFSNWRARSHTKECLEAIACSCPKNVPGEP